MTRSGDDPARRASADAGFTLLEMVCALAILAALTAIALPRFPLATSRPRLEALAIETAALLKADRTAALRKGQAVETRVDAVSGRIEAGASGRALRMPADVRMTAVLPRLCNGQASAARIRFLPSGQSCGGVVALSRGSAAYEIRVNWFTGGIALVPGRAS